VINTNLPPILHRLGDTAVSSVTASDNYTLTNFSLLSAAWERFKLTTEDYQDRNAMPTSDALSEDLVRSQSSSVLFVDMQRLRGRC